MFNLKPNGIEDEKSQFDFGDLSLQFPTASSTMSIPNGL
jgi:hypothetical protein